MQSEEYLEKKIRENPDFHSSLVQSFFQNSLIGQAFTLPSGEIIPNRAMCTMFGYSAEELSTMTWNDLTYPEDRLASQQIIQDIVDGKATEGRLIKRYLRKNQTYFWAEAFTSQFKNPDTAVIHNLTTILDITRQVEHEQEAEQVKQTFETFIDASDDKIFLKDEQFRYLIVNETAARNRGFSKEEFILKQAQDFMSSEEARSCQLSDMEVVQQHKVVINEEKIGERVMENRKFPVALGNGKIGVGGFIRDVTEAVHQREFLRKMAESNRIVTECMTREFQSVQEQVDFALSEALTLTESDCGCIMVYNEPQAELELFAHYHKDKRFRMSEGNGQKMPLAEAGFWGESVHQRKVLVFEQVQPVRLPTNNPCAHMNIQNIMTLPMFDHEKIVALVGFANKPDGYSERDIAAITSLMNGVWMAVNKRLQERRTARLLARLEAMFNNHEAVMFLLEAETGKVLDVNPACLAFYGYTREEMMQKHMYEINAMGKENSEQMRNEVIQNNSARFTTQHKLKNGEIRTVDLYCCSIPYGGKTQHFSILFDISEQVKATKQIEYLAYHDHLTGVYNRRFFDETFQLMADGGMQYPIGVIMGDINGLKLFNDTFGHLNGDTAIRVLVDHMQELLQPNQLLARIGGDEFAIIVPKTNENELKQLIKKLEVVYRPETPQHDMSYLSISFGFSIQRHRRDNLDWLLKEAEAFMYNRKYYSNRSFRSSAIHAIMETLFAKSEREKLHSERVSQLSEKIAKQMKLHQDTVNKIRVAGMLHDIGKIGIDESVLNKPAKLDANEWELMKLHSAKGAKILSNTVEFHQIAEWVLQHHERIDGKGYPNQVKGNEIPLAARIISVADAYDAMTNERPYQKAMSPEEARKVLLTGAGTQWDSKVVDILLEQVVHELKR